MIQKILCPIDFSAASRHAAEYAVKLAEQLQVETIVFLNVFETSVHPTSDLPIEENVEELRSSIQKECSLFLEHLQPSKTILEIQVEQGVIDQEIVRQAVGMDAHMIVMGTNGRSGLSHLLIGSVAEKVIRFSPIPVCTIKVERV